MTRALPAGYAPFATWAEVQEHIRTGAQGGVAYRAPLSYRPTWLVTTRAGAGSARNSPGGTIRVIPWDCPAESDPSTRTRVTSTASSSGPLAPHQWPSDLCS